MDAALQCIDDFVESWTSRDRLIKLKIKKKSHTNDKAHARFRKSCRTSNACATPAPGTISHP